MPARLIYAVHHALPGSSDGYPIRSHGVARALVEVGVRIQVLVAPSALTAKLNGRVEIDGVDYLHVRERSGGSYEQWLGIFKPDAVLAASNWRHANPIQKAAQDLGIPFWYEARGFWELSACARDPAFAESPEFQREMAEETAIAGASERLFTLNRHMSAEWQRRGVSPEKISLIPNGVQSISSGTMDPDPALRAQLGIPSGRVIAYLGSFSVYEGLEDLIIGFAQAYHQGLDAHLLLVGSLSQLGASQRPCVRSAHLLHLAQSHGIADRVVFTGRVPPNAVANYYPLIDLVVIPRRPERVCEIVSPLKPLEAAAHATPLLLSSVAPLADLHDLGPGVHLFEKGSVPSLAQKLLEILGRPTPKHHVHALYPGLERYLWSRTIEPLLEALRQTPPRLRRSLPWQDSAG